MEPYTLRGVRLTLAPDDESSMVRPIYSCLTSTVRDRWSSGVAEGWTCCQRCGARTDTESAGTSMMHLHLYWHILGNQCIAAVRCRNICTYRSVTCAIDFSHSVRWHVNKAVAYNIYLRKLHLHNMTPSSSHLKLKHSSEIKMSGPSDTAQATV